MDRLVVVDADTLLYSTAAASEQRSIEVLHKPSGICKSFANRTEFKKLMKEKGKEITDDYELTEKQEPEPVEHCLYSIKVQAENIIERYAFDTVVFVAGDDANFRLDLPLPSKYKSNRSATIRPVHLKEAHKYFANKYKSLKGFSHEADDLSHILAHQGIAEGREVIVLSPDKDSRGFIGVKLGKYDTEESNLVLVQDMHEVQHSKEKGTKSYGVPWLCIQALIGDPSDFYKPTQLAGVKYGEVSAYKDLKDCKTPKECLEVVVRKYREWYPEDFVYTAWNGEQVESNWKHMLQLYWSCLKMKEKEDDPLSAEEFFSKYGVGLE